MFDRVVRCCVVALFASSCVSPSAMPSTGVVRVGAAPRVADLECFPDGCGFERALVTGTTETFSALTTSTPVMDARCLDANVCEVSSFVRVCCNGEHATVCSDVATNEVFTPWGACLTCGGEANWSQVFSIDAKSAGVTDVEFTAVATPGATVTTGVLDVVGVSVRDAARVEVQVPRVVENGV